MNMSYCQFQNTKGDLYDCLETIEDNDFDIEALEEELSGDEFAALKRIIEICETIAGAEMLAEVED